MSGTQGEQPPATEHLAAIAPPPSGTEAYRRAERGLGLVEDPDRAAAAAAGPRPKGRRFVADLEIAEIDGRGRPGPAWQAKGQSLSRANLIVASRRMCYMDRPVVVAVHLIDDRPFPLRGRVSGCEYDGEGIHLLEIQLTDDPIDASIKAWLANRGRE